MEEKKNKPQSITVGDAIEVAKENITNSSFYFLLWGWVVLVAALLQYVLLINKYTLHYLPWPILTIGTAIVSTVYGYYDSKKQKSKTHIDKFFGVLWMSITAAIFLALIIVSSLADFRTTYAVVMLIFGLGTLVSGIAIRFTALIIGGVLVWLGAVSIIWLDFPNLLLLMAFTMLCSYIIPGYMLRMKSERRRELATH